MIRKKVELLTLLRRGLMLSFIAALSAAAFTATGPAQPQGAGPQLTEVAGPQDPAPQGPQGGTGGQATVSDPDDFYYYAGQPVRLNRSVTERVVKFRPGAGGERQRVVESLTASANVGSEIRSEGRTFQIVTLSEAEAVAGGMTRFRDQLSQRDEVEFSAPVFYNPQTGLRMLPTEEIVVKLKPGGTRQELADVARSLDLTIDKAMWGTQDEFVLRLNSPKTTDAVERSRRLHETGRFLWAEPNFIQEFQKQAVPNDPRFGQQWHLNNTGQFGGTAGADIKAVSAWDIQQGSSAITIAIIDDGIEKTHEDLAASIFVNAAEIPGNGLDDDGNTFIDDVSGWDFNNNDNDPSPFSAQDNHGTAVAGVAAARGDNSIGVSGSCRNCRLLPVKIFSPSFAGDIAAANAIRYASRFADVLNNSWGGGSPSATIQSAVQFATTTGRGGKGSVVLFATGNSASGYGTYTVTGFVAGTYTFRWEYTKDATLSSGDDSAWLGWVLFPGGERVTFENGALPGGWTTGGDAGWSFVTDPTHADEGSCFTHAAKAGVITHGQSTYLQVTKTVSAGNLATFRWVSSQTSFDGLRVRVDLNNDGVFEFTGALQSGVPLVVPAVSYPAAYPESIGVGATSNFDCRSHYSQYGPEVAFVSPSSAGPFNLGIETTDRMGAAGYDPGNYTQAAGGTGFGGTSSATPLASGVAGLILSQNPALTRLQVLQIMQNSADKVGPEPYVLGRNNRYGFGRINAYQALLGTPAAKKRRPQITSH